MVNTNFVALQRLTDLFQSVFFQCNFLFAPISIFNKKKNEKTSLETVEIVFFYLFRLFFSIFFTDALETLSKAGRYVRIFDRLLMATDRIVCSSSTFFDCFYFGRVCAAVSLANAWPPTRILFFSSKSSNGKLKLNLMALRRPVLFFLDFYVERVRNFFCNRL